MAQSLPAEESRCHVGKAQLPRHATLDLPAVIIANLVDMDTCTSQSATSRRDRQQIPAVCKDTTGVLPTAPTPQMGPRDGDDNIDNKILDRREERDDHFVVSWEQFLQSTTFHGIRYIFEKTEFSLRRLVYIYLILKPHAEISLNITSNQRTQHLGRGMGCYNSKGSHWQWGGMDIERKKKKFMGAC